MGDGCGPCDTIRVYAEEGLPFRQELVDHVNELHGDLREARREYESLKAECLRVKEENEELRARIEDPQGNPRECGA